MYLFVKLWTPKSAWYDLSQEERVKFIKHAQELMVSLHDRGMETIAWMEILSDVVPYKVDHIYCSIYRFKHQQDAHDFHTAMVKFKWYDYFEQTNVVGEAENPGAVLARIVNLPSI